MPRTKVFTIDSNFSFLDVLATGFLKKIKFNRDVLAQSIFFLPTQRSAANFARCITNLFDNKTVIYLLYDPLGISWTKNFFSKTMMIAQIWRLLTKKKSFHDLEGDYF